MVMASFGSFAEGGFGLSYDKQLSSIGSLSFPGADSRIEANDFSLYGFGVLPGGVILGGFGQFDADIRINQSISVDGEMLYYGLFGGLLVGESLGKKGGIRFNIACKLGVGYQYLLIPESDDAGIFVSALISPYAELSLPLARWLRVAARVGYEYIHSFSGIGVSAGDYSNTSISYAAGCPYIGGALVFGKN
jgi:hypothetical protein